MHPGEKVGKYRLTEGPVEGGRGAVWFAVDTELARSVVLKRARLENSGPGAFEELLAEARALAKFSHPHVVTLYDAVRTGRDKRATFWLVMEHVRGGSLDVPVKLAPEHAAAIGAQIADALAALHAKGLVHCDVKPGNIVLTEDRVAKLADFGAAHRVDSSATITPNGPLSLTPAYAAPEAFRGAPERASDVFSLGVTLYVLTTGTPPLRGPGHVVRLEAISPHIGPLSALITAMLHTDPRARPTAATAHQALTDLAGGARDLATLPLGLVARDWPVPPDGSTLPAPPRLLPSAALRRNPLLAFGALAVAALAVAVPLLLLSLSDGDGNGAEAQAAPSPSSPSATDPAFLGEPRTADPCALLDARGFDAYEATELDRHQGNFNRCDVLLLEGNDDVVDVRVELDADELPEGEKSRTTGRVTVVEPAVERDKCERALSVTGARDSSLRVTVAAREPDQVKQHLCDTAEIATRHAVKVLNDGEVPRRDGDFAANSLAHQDACTLLDVAALAKVPGVDAGDPDAGFGHWACQWKSTTADIEVDLQFDQGRLPSGKDTERTKVGDRSAVVLPDYDGAGSCRIEVVHRPYMGPDRMEGTERVALTAKGDDLKGSAPCALAKDLARSVVASLPPV
ncbi:protein kinase [Streptomyces sp. AC563]|uniref:serine/threonine-protein kinase n=1 Tax=Streptomyces buecherae TaxID=2763006 RepID=UPI00164E52B5|nr:serine/threonine-protein kinase [Streptomyces buecherae]MBC3990511.1 protein kinase [Streptomyces buecherae]